MAFSLLFGIVLLLCGGMGLPMGMPPGPEDPMMSKLAPEECLMYASWSGVAKVDPDANPTEKWMSQPKVSKLILKLRKAYLGYLDKQSEQSNDKVFKQVYKIFSHVVDAGSVNPAAVYLNDIEIKAKSLKADGAVVVKLGDHNDEVIKLNDDLHKIFGEMKPRELEFRSFQPFDFDGQKAIKIFSGFDEIPIFASVHQGYFVIAIGEESMGKVIANMKTPQPKWLTELRERNKIKRVASVGYLDGKLLDRMRESSRFHPIGFHRFGLPKQGY